MKIAIVGAGIAGLAAAVRLAVAGHRVTVYEAGTGPGGKLSEFTLPGGYRFDFGPSLFTMPQYVDELFQLAGENPRDHFRYRRLPEVCRYWWPDGTEFRAPAATDELARAAAETFDVPAAAVERFMARAARKYELTGRTFLEQSLHRLATWLDPSVARALLRIPGLDLFRSMHAVHAAAFEDPRLVQLFDRFATYNGSNPYKAPGLLSMIPHFEHHFGAYLPEGGMYDITTAVYRLGERLGVKYHFGKPVERIGVAEGRARSVRVGGKEVAYDRIVCNMDVWLAYDRLLPEVKRPRRTLGQQKSTSAVIFYWGVDRSFPQLGLHNIFFSRDYAGEFTDLEGGALGDDVTVYVNVSSKLVAEDAPAGHENWFVMVNAPADTGQDWETMVSRLRERVIAILSDHLAPASAPSPTTAPPANWLEAHIRAERTVTPPAIEQLTGSHQGALYGTSSNNALAAFLRHPNFSRRIDHLYFLGGSVHPGGGIPLCLLSARIVADLVADERDSETPYSRE